MISSERVLALVERFCLALNVPVGYSYRLVGEMADSAVSVYLTDSEDSPLAILLIEDGSIRELYRHDLADAGEGFSDTFTTTLGLFSSLSLYFFPFYSHLGLGGYYSHLLGRSCTSWRDVVSVLGSLAGIDFYPATAGLSTEGFLIDVYAGRVSVKSYFTFSEPYDDTMQMLSLILVTLSYWMEGEGLDIVYPADDADDAGTGSDSDADADAGDDGGLGGLF